MLHSFHEVEVKVLVAARHKAYNFVLVYEEGDPLIRGDVAFVEYFRERLPTLSYEIKLVRADFQGSQRDVFELYTFVKHCHGSKESTFDVVLYVISANTPPVEE